MNALKTGDIVKLKNGGAAKILSEFGAGGSRVRASFAAHDKSLKNQRKLYFSDFLYCIMKKRPLNRSVLSKL